MMFPKPGKRIKALKKNFAFQVDVLLRDNQECMNPECPTRKKKLSNFLMVLAHHIMYKSSKVDNSIENGISLCAICHKWVHGDNNPKWKGVRISGDQYMLNILDYWIERGVYKVTKYYEWVKNRVERKL